MARKKKNLGETVGFHTQRGGEATASAREEASSALMSLDDGHCAAAAKYQREASRYLGVAWAHRISGGKIQKREFDEAQRRVVLSERRFDKECKVVKR